MNQQKGIPNAQYGYQMDPFGKINLKARKVVESVERSRLTPADPRNGSTGGSFDEDIEFNDKGQPQNRP